MVGATKGYTLIELIVVLSLMGLILWGLAGPLVKGMTEHAELSTAAKQLQTAIKQTRVNAMQSNSIWKLVIALPSTASTYRQHATQNVWVQESNGLTLDPAVSIAGTQLPNLQIVFGADGSPYEDPQSDLPQSSTDTAMAQVRTVTLQYGASSQKSLYLLPETGYATLETTQ